jgi:hypothetical protein
VENPQKLDLDPTKIERVTFIANFVDFVDNPNGTLVGLIMFCACFVVDIVLFILCIQLCLSYKQTYKSNIICCIVLYSQILNKNVLSKLLLLWLVDVNFVFIIFCLKLSDLKF